MRVASFILDSAPLFTTAVLAATNDVFKLSRTSLHPPPRRSGRLVVARMLPGQYLSTIVVSVANAPKEVSNPKGHIFPRDVTKGLILLDEPRDLRSRSWVRRETNGRLFRQHMGFIDARISSRLCTRTIRVENKHVDERLSSEASIH